MIIWELKTTVDGTCQLGPDNVATGIFKKRAHDKELIQKITKLMIKRMSTQSRVKTLAS